MADRNALMDFLAGAVQMASPVPGGAPARSARAAAPVADDAAAQQAAAANQTVRDFIGGPPAGFMPRTQRLVSGTQRAAGTVLAGAGATNAGAALLRAGGANERAQAQQAQTQRASRQTEQTEQTDAPAGGGDEMTPEMQRVLNHMHLVDRLSGMSTGQRQRLMAVTPQPGQPPSPQDQARQTMVDMALQGLTLARDPSNGMTHEQAQAHESRAMQLLIAASGGNLGQSMLLEQP